MEGKTNIRWFLIVAFLISILLLSSPVSALTDTFTSNYVADDYTALYQIAWFNKTAVIYNVSKLEWSGYCYNTYDIPLPHSAESEFWFYYSPAVPHTAGYGWLEATGGTLAEGWVDCTIDLTFPTTWIEEPTQNFTYFAWTGYALYGNETGNVFGDEYTTPYRTFFGGELQSVTAGDYIVTYLLSPPPPPPAPICSFTASPTSGTSPLSVSFADTSNNTPTSWDWHIENNWTGFTEEIHSTLQSFTSLLYNPTVFDVTFNATNAYGTCSIFSPNYITVISPTTVTTTLTVVDAITHSSISGASVGLQNITSLAWTNATAATGSHTFTSSDGSSALPLAIGQTVTLAASAYGYNSRTSTISIPYPGYPTSIFLMPTTAVNATGTFWLTVTITKNEDGLPLNSAVVQVLSGGNSYQQYTGDNGITTFQNITSSYTFSVTAFHQAYTEQTKVLPVTADFMNTSFSLVRKGAIPVTTPMTPATTSTTSPVVSWTDAITKEPISESEGSALDAFLSLARALPAMFNIGIGIIMIWLLWILVYELTGGRVLDKLMKRGRRK